MKHEKKKYHYKSTIKQYQLTSSTPCGKGVSSQSFCGNLWIIFPRPAPDPINKIKVNLVIGYLKI